MNRSIYQSAEFRRKYENDDPLGATYTKEWSEFALWSPFASRVSVKLYSCGLGGEIVHEETMTPSSNGVWRTRISGDLHGRYYTYNVTIGDITNEVTDIYAKSAGIDGIRAQIADLTKTSPPNWEKDCRVLPDSPVDAVVYEVHIRDVSCHPSSGIINKGKFLGLTEFGTQNPGGDFTGLSHLKELGVTHVQLMPIFSFRTAEDLSDGYNWGYDPNGYNYPKGGYSTNPFDGLVRIYELKKMIQTLHSHNLGVIMDVVYNHTYLRDSDFEKTVPGYYYRTDEKGGFTNGSGCGNETASEAYMMRRFIKESVLYWAEEYHIDGFRFDLMGLHDIKLINDIRTALDEADSRILIYGEGWWGGMSSLPPEEAAIKQNARLLNPRVAFFNDVIRDGAKGHVFNEKDRGFLSGNRHWHEAFRSGITGSINLPEPNGNHLTEPTQCVTYLSCHDNLTLWDKLLKSVIIRTRLIPVQNISRPVPFNKKYCDKIKPNPRLQINKMCAAALFTSQGMPFFPAGEEFCRSKGGNSNSYDAGDSVNAIDWSKKTRNKELFRYYQGLIELRKAHPAFRLRKASEISLRIKFLEPQNNSKLFMGYIISGVKNEPWEKIAVLFNPSARRKTVTLPGENWIITVNGEAAGIHPLGTVKGSTLKIPPRTAIVAYTCKRTGIGGFSS